MRYKIGDVSRILGEGKAIYFNAIICFTGIKSRCGSKLGRLRTASEVL